MAQSYAPPASSRRAPILSNGPQHLLGEFPTYVGAEQVVDRLSDNGFPVVHTRIVGNGLRTVEYVTGRITSGTAAMAGVASGAWFGLFVGLLLSLFSTNSTWIAVLLACAAIGSVWGAAFGFFAHRTIRGRRDFGSVKGLEAEQDAVYVDADRADEAFRLSGLM